MSNVQCVRTIRIAERPNLIWVEIETDEGLIGLGEILPRRRRRSRRCCMRQIAPWLVGRDCAADRGGLPPPDDALSRLPQRQRRGAGRQRHRPRPLGPGRQAPRHPGA